MRIVRPWWLRLILCAACMDFVVGLAGCDTSKPEKFAGFASEQLSEQIEIVSAKLDESIEDNQQSQAEILAAVRDLSQVVAGMQLTSQKQIDELKKVSGKAKAKLTSTGDEKDGVATLDPNAAPSAKLEIDSLDDAAAIIEALTKRVEALEAKSKQFASSSSETSGGNSSGSLKSSFSGNSSGSYQGSYQTYSAPVYSEVTYSIPTQTQPSAYSGTYYAGSVQPTYQSTNTSQCYTDPTTGKLICNENVQSSQVQQYRIGLLGRKIPVR